MRIHNTKIVLDGQNKFNNCCMKELIMIIIVSQKFALVHKIFEKIAKNIF